MNGAAGLDAVGASRNQQVRLGVELGVRRSDDPLAERVDRWRKTGRRAARQSSHGPHVMRQGNCQPSRRRAAIQRDARGGEPTPAVVARLARWPLQHRPHTSEGSPPPVLPGPPGRLQHGHPVVLGHLDLLPDLLDEPFSDERGTQRIKLRLLRIRHRCHQQQIVPQCRRSARANRTPCPKTQGRATAHGEWTARQTPQSGRDLEFAA